MSNPSAAILVIGDEILSGRTRDSNLHYLSCELTKIGINLQEARIIPDNATEIINAVKWLSSKYNYLFTSGGIGPTHDDITADCIAAAFETEINIREDAFKLLERELLKVGNHERLLVSLAQLSFEQKLDKQAKSYFLKLIESSDIWSAWFQRLLKF